MSEPEARGPEDHERSECELALPALRAGAHHFQGHVTRGEAAAIGARCDRVGQALAVQFLGIAAVAANEEEAAMRLAGMAAADEGVQALDAMGPAVVDHDIDRAVT